MACAVAIADRGSGVTLLTASLPGEASLAAAGMLAPSVERATGAAHEFALAARDRYPGFLAALRDRTGLDVPLLRSGILELLPGVAGVAHGDLPPGSLLIDRDELARLEPAVAHAAGAVLHPRDGAVDNVALWRALRASLERDSRVRIVADRVVSLRGGDGAAAARGASGTRYEAGTVVLAAGVWAPRIEGLPRRLPVEPVRGQMLAFSGAPLTHVAYGPRGYLVPRRDGRVLAGSTMERVGFEVRTTPEGLASVRAAAEEICPGIAGRTVVSEWSGLRPVTPDLLPILGRDPHVRSLVYACGHSRNGVLLAPLTGDCVAAVVLEQPSPHDLEAFAIARFA